VRGNHDNVHAGGAHPGHPDPGLFDQAGERHPAVDVGLVPDGYARVGQAEDADLDRLLTLHPDSLDHVGREGRAPGAGIQRVGAEQRKVELIGKSAQQRDPVVELVIAQSGGVVADVVHGRSHRMHIGVGDRGDTREVVGQRRPLDRVARIDHQRVVTPTL
jgi:hypothetical protein